MRNNRLFDLILAAMFAAVIAILAQFSIPMPLVPLTLQTFAVGLVVSILGRRVGTWAVLIYILMGVIGLPVFAGGAAGIHVVFGPTGGYIVGFIAAALVIGTIIEKTKFNLTWLIVANLVGALVTLVIGTVWMKYAYGLAWQAAIGSGMISFLIPGAVKAVLSSVGALLVKQALPKRFLNKLSA
jgi:biotin transport system substrate-specific component